MIRTLYTTNIENPRAGRSGAFPRYTRSARPLHSLHSLHLIFQRGHGDAALARVRGRVLRNCDSSTVLLSALPHFALKGSLPSLRLLSYFWYIFCLVMGSCGSGYWFLLLCAGLHSQGVEATEVYTTTRGAPVRACYRGRPYGPPRVCKLTQPGGCYCQVTTGTDWCSVFINKAGGGTVDRALRALCRTLKKRKSFKDNSQNIFAQKKYGQIPKMGPRSWR